MRNGTLTLTKTGAALTTALSAISALLLGSSVAAGALLVLTKGRLGYRPDRELR